MSQKTSVSSQREKLVRKSAASILDKPLSERQKKELHSLREKADSDIDFSDAPELTDDDLRNIPKRPTRMLVAARIDTDIVEWLQSFGPGYSTRINTILRASMQRHASKELVKR